MKDNLILNLKIWRQKDRATPGSFVTYTVENVSPDSSFLEMLDLLNENLLTRGENPVAFDHDCREGICGMCSLVINGIPHGYETGTTTCQLHMRKFQSGDTIVIEPWRAKAFPVLKDLIVDRSALDRIIQSGGFISVKTGSAPEANSQPLPKELADQAFAAAACIGCGACVAACTNASAMLFVAAKLGHLSRLPQGRAERHKRVLSMIKAMDAEGFGNCTNEGECEAVCPKEINLAEIARLNRAFLLANLE